MKTNSFLYLIIIFALSLIGIISITLINIYSKDGENIQIIATIVGFLTPTILSLIALMVKDTHDLTNSRMSELLDISKIASKAEGKAEEVAKKDSSIVIKAVAVGEEAVDLLKDIKTTVTEDKKDKP